MFRCRIGRAAPLAFLGADLANLLNEAAILTARQNMLRIGQNSSWRGPWSGSPWG